MKQYNNGENIYPFELEEKYNHISIGLKKVAVLLFVGFPLSIEMFSIIDSINNIGECEISMHIQKLEKIKVLKKLTSLIASSKEELVSSHENRIDADVLNSGIEFAKKMRRDIQVENEDIYELNMSITIYDEDIEKLKTKQKDIANYLYAKQIILKPANFRQKDAYLSTLPLNIKKIKAENFTKLLTTTSLALLFPFYTDNLFEKDGIIIGKAKEKLCVYDIFSEAHSNYNMSILGSSGSGKSYFVKLMILRNKYLGRRQLIFDPEGEYVSLIQKIGGKIITPNTYNMLYIEENFVKDNPTTVLYKKIDMIIKQLCEIREIPEILQGQVREKLKYIYAKKGITNNIESLYKTEEKGAIYINKKYLTSDEFPAVSDIINEINKDKKIKAKDKGELKEILNKVACKETSNGEKEEDVILFDLSGCVQENFKQYMNIFFSGILEYKKEKTIIYIDEIWKCVSFGADEQLTTKIFNMYKTLRKEKMGIVSITQDISDFFTYKEGLFGKSILNNSYNKLIFNLQYIDTDEFAKMVNQTKEQINKIKTYERGKAFMQLGNSNVELKVEASNWEHVLIEGRDLSEESVNCNR